MQDAHCISSTNAISIEHTHTHSITVLCIVNEVNDMAAFSGFQFFEGNFSNFLRLSSLHGQHVRVANELTQTKWQWSANTMKPKGMDML